MATHFPEYPQLEFPLYKESMEIGSIPLMKKFRLFKEPGQSL